jgi:hypothetical protein
MAKPGSLAAGPDLFIKGIKALSDGLPNIRRLPWENLVVGATVFFFFTLLGVGLYHQALTPDFPPHHLARLPLAEEVILTGRLYRPSRVGPERVRLYLAVDTRKSPTGWVPATGNLMVTLPVTAPALTLPPVGTHVVVRGKLRDPRALLNPGSWNQPRYLAGEGIFRQMHLSDSPHLIFISSEEAPSLAEQLRGGIRNILKKMPPDIEAIYLSMLLGDQGKVTPEMRQRLSRTGTSHLIWLKVVNQARESLGFFVKLQDILRPQRGGTL